MIAQTIMATITTAIDDISNTIPAAKNTGYSNESQEEDCDAIIKGAGPFGGDVKAKDISFFKDKSLLKGENGKEYKRNDEGKLEELN